MYLKTHKNMNLNFQNWIGENNPKLVRPLVLWALDNIWWKSEPLYSNDVSTRDNLVNGDENVFYSISKYKKVFNFSFN